MGILLAASSRVARCPGHPPSTPRWFGWRGEVAAVEVVGDGLADRVAGNSPFLAETRAPPNGAVLRSWGSWAMRVVLCARQASASGFRDAPWPGWVSRCWVRLNRPHVELPALDRLKSFAPSSDMVVAHHRDRPQ
jgi:hypothetical protein